MSLDVLPQAGFHARMFDHWAAKVVALGYSVARVEEVRRVAGCCAGAKLSGPAW